LVHLLIKFDQGTSTNLNHLINTHWCTIIIRIIDFSNGPNWFIGYSRVYYHKILIVFYCRLFLIIFHSP
jgi:hypothetical protein